MRAAVLSLLAACTFERGFGSHGPSPSDDAAIDADRVTADAASDATPAKQFVLAYNLHGPAHVGIDFPGMWAADPGGICDGEVWDVAFDVANTADDPLFQHYQYRLAGGAIACNLGTNLASGM